MAHDGPELRMFDKGALLRWPWHFDYGKIVRGVNNGGLMDKETVTSAASEVHLKAPEVVS
jgi:hypothetical protein